jgi:hypothetical protein
MGENAHSQKSFRPTKKHRPDSLERGVNFGCGTVFGLLVGFCMVRGGGGDIPIGDMKIPFYLIRAVGVGLIFGVLATFFGRRFWRKFFDI